MDLCGCTVPVWNGTHIKLFMLKYHTVHKYKQMADFVFTIELSYIDNSAYKIIFKFCHNITGSVERVKKTRKDRVDNS